MTLTGQNRYTLTKTWPNFTIPCSRVLLGKLIVPTEREGSLPWTQQPATSPCSVPYKSSPRPSSCSFHIVLPSTPQSPKLSLSLRSPHQKPCVLLSTTRATRPAHPILRNQTIAIMFGKHWSFHCIHHKSHLHLRLMANCLGDTKHPNSNRKLHNYNNIMIKQNSTQSKTKKNIIQGDQKVSVHLTILIPTQLILRWPSQNTFGMWTVLY